MLAACPPMPFIPAAKASGWCLKAPVVDDFMDRIMINPDLNANPRVEEAHHRVSKAGFKYLVTEMVW